MPLSDDQKAMLRLLARDQSYEDIAALMGLSVDEVAARAQGAVAQLESEGIPAPALPAPPGGNAAPPPSPPEPPAAKEPEPPAVKEPEPEPVAPKSPEPVAAAAPPPSGPSKPKRPRDNGKLLAIGGGVAGLVVIVVLFVLLISSSGGDGDDSSSTTAADRDTTAQTAANDDEPDPTMAVLKAVDGSDGSGKAVFGNLEEKLVLAIEAKGLEPSAKGTRYAICIAASPDQVLPIASTAVGAKGTIEASVELPAELLLYLANETYSEIVITRANTARLTAETKSQSKEPTYSGVPVLRGEITGSLIGNKQLLKQAQEAKKAE